MALQSRRSAFQMRMEARPHHLGSIPECSYEQDSSVYSFETDSLERPNSVRFSFETDSLERPNSAGYSFETDSLERPNSARYSFETDSLERPNSAGYSFETDSLESPTLGCSLDPSFEQDSLERTTYSGQDMSCCSSVGGIQGSCDQDSFEQPRSDRTSSSYLPDLQDCFDSGALDDDSDDDLRNIDLEAFNRCLTTLELTINSFERRLLMLELEDLKDESLNLSQSRNDMSQGQRKLKTWGQDWSGDDGININYKDVSCSWEDSTSSFPNYSFPVYGIEGTPVPIGASTPNASPRRGASDMEDDSLEEERRRISLLMDSLEIATDIVEVDMERLAIKERAQLNGQ